MADTGAKKAANDAGLMTPKRSMAMSLVCATPRQGKAVVNYSLGEKLGQGAHAIVYRAIDVNSGATVAIKRIPANALTSLDVVVGEIELLANLEHPNIVQYLGFVRVDDDALYIVLEYCENGSLSALCHRFGVFPENLIAMYMGQVLEGLEYLHQQGTIHRDVKGANILTTKDGVAKLTDFGVAIRVGGAQGEQGITGTPNWMAPEIIQMGDTTAACDIWSLGCTVIELRTGQPPYGNMPDIAAMYAMVQNDMPPLPLDASSRMRDFLCLCFQKDFRIRSDATELKSHAWIKRHCAKRVPSNVAQTVKDWNSPSRKMLLHTPSKLDLKPEPQRDLHDGSPQKAKLMAFVETDSFEAGFANPGSRNGSTDELGSDLLKPIEEAKPSMLLQSPFTRKPELELPKRSALVVPSQILPSPSQSQMITKAWAENDEDGDDFDDLAVQLESALQTKPGKPVVYSSDVFEGIGELLDDVPPEQEALAFEEASKLIQRLESIKEAPEVAHSVADSDHVFMRLSELLVAEPGIKKPLADWNILLLTLTLAQRDPIKLAPSVLEFLLIFCGNSESLFDRFSLSDGLGVLQCLAPQEPLRAVIFMLEYVQHYKFGAHLLASRRETLGFLAECLGNASSFKPMLNESELPIISSCAAQCILAVFKDFHSRRRADVWRAFGVRLLWDNIIKALTKSSEAIPELYTLITYFARCPPELICEVLSKHHLRQLMRCFRDLPTDSEFRPTILHFFRDVSTVPAILVLMERGALGPYFVHIFRECLCSADQKQSHANLVALLPLLYNYCRLSPTRQESVAKYGLLVYLHKIDTLEPGLKEFSIPILLSMTQNPLVYKHLWAANGMASLIKLLRYKGWEAAALLAINTLWSQEGDRVKLEFARLNGQSNLIYTALHAQREIFAAFIQPLSALLETHAAELSEMMPARPILAALQRQISQQHASTVLVKILQVAKRVVNAFSDGPKEYESIGLRKAMEQLSEDPVTPIICKRIVQQIERLYLENA